MSVRWVPSCASPSGRLSRELKLNTPPAKPASEDIASEARDSWEVIHINPQHPPDKPQGNYCDDDVAEPLAGGFGVGEVGHDRL